MRAPDDEKTLFRLHFWAPQAADFMIQSWPWTPVLKPFLTMLAR
jgi:hypothetical protein